jgi:hypothetical protein
MSLLLFDLFLFFFCLFLSLLGIRQSSTFFATRFQEFATNYSWLDPILMFACLAYLNPSNVRSPL